MSKQSTAVVSDDRTAPVHDAELMQRYLHGEPDAVAVIDAWIATASRPYRRRLANQLDDVAQEIRLKVLRLLQDGRFRGESSLKTYLWRVVSNTCIDAIRKRETSGRQVELDESPAVGEATSQEAEQGSVACEVADLVLKVLEQVPAHCKQIWTMIIEGFSYRELSLALGLSENALRVRALRCRERAIKIRRQLAASPEQSCNLSAATPPKKMEARDE